jgi:hypothetical protein
MITLALVAVFGVFLGPMLVRGVRARRVRKQVLLTGEDAVATLVGTWDTGVRLNDDPQVGMRIEVHPPGGPPFHAEVSHFVSIVHLPVFQPGARLWVKFDPPTREVALVSVAGPGAADGSAAISLIDGEDAERVLMRLQHEREELRRTGTSAPAKVVRYAPIGIYVNGDNPTVNLTLEVHPPGGEPFMAEAFGNPVAETSIPKFQPGEMVTVRYDSRSPGKVALERSGA